MKLSFLPDVKSSTYFPILFQKNSMAGIIVQLALSLIIIWFYQKNNLSVLGLQPSWLRVNDFFLFLVITAICCASGFLLRMYFGKEKSL